MKYVNTRTGAVVETDCQISGGDWTPAQATANNKDKKSADKGKAKDKKSAAAKSEVTADGTVCNDGGSEPAVEKSDS